MGEKRQLKMYSYSVITDSSFPQHINFCLFVVFYLFLISFSLQIFEQANGYSTITVCCLLLSFTVIFN